MRALVWISVIVAAGCSDKAPAPEPGIEATVVEVKPIAEAPTPTPTPPPTPTPIPTPTPKPALAKHVTQPIHKPPTKTEPAGSAHEPDPNKPQLEQNPYLYNK